MRADELVNRVREFRARHGDMTQAELAERTDVSRQTIIAIEVGRYAPSLPLALRIAQVFGARVEDVFELATKSKRR
jgi:putative transcriptional regulator